MYAETFQLDGTDLPELIDEFNRTRRERGEPVMTQRRLAALAGVSETLVSLQVSGQRVVTPEQQGSYIQILRMEPAS